MKPHKAAKLLEQATASQQAGNLQHAAQYYQKFLKETPDSAPVLHALGGIYYQLGDMKSAGRYLAEAHRADPGNIDYLNDLGAFHQAQGEYAEAVGYLGELVRRAPDTPQVHYNLGLALHGVGRLMEAVNAFSRCLELQPDDVAAHFNLGVTYQDMGRYSKAEKCYRAAIKIEPRWPEAHFKLGEVFNQVNLDKAALESFQQAYRLLPDSEKYAVACANQLELTGNTEAGLKLLQDALSRQPESVQLLVALGNLLHIHGQLDEAESVFHRALSLKQDFALAFSRYARIRKFTADDIDLIRSIETAPVDPCLPVQEQAELHYALGKVHDDCGNYDQAFSHYSHANDLQSRLVSHDRALHESTCDKIISVFGPRVFQELSFLGTHQDRPVFIVGMPRSGTTLTEQIIASHPMVAGGGELKYFSSVCGNLRAMFHISEPWPNGIRLLKKTDADKIINHYLDLLDRKSSTARLVTDKYPSNFLYLGLIRLLFPNAAVIHCRRDPLDVCLSIFFQHFNERLSYACNLLDIGHTYLQYAKLMAHWRKVLPGPYLEIHYEDLVSDQECWSRELIKFIGLEWDEACLSYYQTERDVKTASVWQVRQPIYRKSMHRWKNYEKYLGPLMQLFKEIDDEL